MENKEFVSYEIAVALKKLGFDEICLVTYHKELHTIIPIYTEYSNQDVIKAPLKQQAFRWFREKYELFSFVFIFDEGFGYETFKEGISQINDSFDTYEEAENACIDKLLELCKQQDNENHGNKG